MCSSSWYKNYRVVCHKRAIQDNPQGVAYYTIEQGIIPGNHPLEQSHIPGLSRFTRRFSNKSDYLVLHNIVSGFTWTFTRRFSNKFDYLVLYNNVVAGELWDFTRWLSNIDNLKERARANHQVIDSKCTKRAGEATISEGPDESQTLTFPSHHPGGTTRRSGRISPKKEQLPASGNRHCTIHQPSPFSIM